MIFQHFHAQNFTAITIHFQQLFQFNSNFQRYMSIQNSMIDINKNNTLLQQIERASEIKSEF